MGNKEEAKIDGVSDEVDKLSNKRNHAGVAFDRGPEVCYSFPPKTSTIPIQQWELLD
ncbi:predicted protein [Arabidopsis lyrata subsp. lyrata]|uniref:Predicted protein n=1 Tax=Arabidopsis lyrata subsp. lyrata TaxID=81972 RepID=D7MQF0_ARALL|nr:predicted protein [Arabidopsis lyrata subsp. lyrata]